MQRGERQQCCRNPAPGRSLSAASADVAFRGRRQVLQFPRRNVTRISPSTSLARGIGSAAIIRPVNFLFMNSSRHVSKKILFISRESTNASVFRVRDPLGLPPAGTLVIATQYGRNPLDRFQVVVEDTLRWGKKIDYVT